jgi:type IX secretion system PorP/SprF family membrane protein
MKKGIKKYFAALIIFLLCLGGKAQQLHFYSSWYDYAMLYNPSIVGNDYHVNVGLLHRTQFAGFEGAPVMNLILADGKLKKRTAYVGGFVSNQHKGIFTNTQAQAMYAHRFNLGERIYFKLGVSLGVLDQNLNYASIVVQNVNDPNIFLSNQHKAALDANAGFSFYLKDFQLGFSVPALLGSTIKYNDNQNVRAYYAMSRHFAASARYDIPLNAEKELYLTPFVLTRFVANAPLQFDGGLMFDWKLERKISCGWNVQKRLCGNSERCIYLEQEIFRCL